MPSPTPPIVRMPPSPTGYLHLGTARTALFNYLFAAQQGGEIIFRWEDTDRARSKAEYEEEIFEGLAWLGMDFQKNNKVYRQTENEAKHKATLEKLWEDGKVFPCFVTPDEIESQKQAAQKAKQNFVFWSPFRDEERSVLEEKMASGEKYVWRIKTPKDQEVAFNDLIRGDIQTSSNTLGDFAIARSDGSILYLLTNVVDDIDQDITHIIKGEDHISNTPKQLLIFEALGASAPLYAHIPLVLDTKGAKLSKRNVDPEVCILIRDFRAQGFLPQAVVNGLVFLGWHPKTEEEVFSLSELEQRFTLEGINKGGAKYDFEKMKWFNHQWMRKLPVEEVVEAFKSWEEAKGRSPAETGQAGEVEAGKLLRAIEVAREKAQTFVELWEEIQYVLEPLEEVDASLLQNEKMGIDEALAEGNIKEVASLLQNIPEDQFTADHIKEKCIETITRLGQKNGQFLWPFRVALSGRPKSMGPFHMCEIMGKEESLKRIEKALKII